MKPGPHIILACLIALAGLAFGSQRRQGAVGNDFDPQSLSQTVADELKQTGTPGTAIAIVRGDKVIFNKAFGVADIETGAQATSDMLFQVGSTTKTFVAAVVLKLALHGQLSLDAAIGDYVHGLGPRVSKVTIHQLLTHTAGLIDKLDDHGSPDESLLASGVRSFVNDGFVFTEPGEIFSYSNMGYDLLALLIQERTNKLFADAMQEELFAPLGMTRTTFRLTTAVTYPLAVGNVDVTRVCRPVDNNVTEWGSGGLLYSNVNDIARFAIAFMNEGKLDRKQVLDPTIIRQMETPYVRIPSRFINGRYGYGLMLHDYEGLHVVEHHGSVPGFGCTFEMVPEYHFALIALYNRPDTAGGRLKKMKEAVFGMLTPLAPVEPEHVRLPQSMSQAEIAGYVGKYRHGKESTIELVAHDGKLETDDGAPIVKLGPQRFQFINPSGPPTPFGIVRGADARHQYLHINLHAWAKVE